MNILKLLSVHSVVLILILSLTGCATTRQSSTEEVDEEIVETVETVDPLTPVEATIEYIEPIKARTAEEILASAEDALKSANAAQENGDHNTAMEQYALMLQMLLEADLDPAILYNLRTEFERVIGTTIDQSGILAKKKPGWTAAEFDPISVAGDLEIPFPLPRRVLKEIDKLENGHRKSFQTALDRSHIYLPYIKREFARAGLPEDLAFLAMIESLFKAKVKSRAGAMGMWQFMRATGRRYGLRVDNQIDDRLNWQRATQAAIDYLTELYDIFGGHWPLAVVAYNKGEGGLSRAINSNDGEYNIWKLIEEPPASYHLRLESKNYYPKLLAYIIVAKNPERYGFKLNPCPPDSTMQVPVMGLYSLDDLNENCNLPRGTLRGLNPQLLRGKTLSLGECKVVIPADSHSDFLAALKNTKQIDPQVYLASSRSYGSGYTHKVRSGETLGSIAKKYGTTANRLKRDNNISNPRRIQIGQRIRITGSRRGKPGGTTQVAGGRKMYKIQRRDTLSIVAKSQGVSIKNIQKWNNMGGSTTIIAGKWLYVSAPDTTLAATKYSDEKIYHTVKANEYPGKIAHAYQVSLNDFLSWNNLTMRSKINIGDKMVIYRPVKATASVETASTGRVKSQPSGTKNVVHTVRKGENASVISKNYGVKTRDFLAWNGLTSRSVLHIGDKCVVYTGNKPDNSPVVEVAPKKNPLEKANSQKQIHVVRNGQNPTTIARRYGVKLNDLLAWNNLTKKSVLQIGEKIVVYTD